MKENKFAQKLFKMQIGESVTLKKGEDFEGEFLRVPSGWIYRYYFRGNVTSCFVPYSEECRYWDMDLSLAPCPFCSSTDIVLSSIPSGESRKDINWEIKCLSCGANSGIKNDKINVVKAWNDVWR